jgi:hypothetical protein
MGLPFRAGMVQGRCILTLEFRNGKFQVHQLDFEGGYPVRQASFVGLLHGLDQGSEIKPVFELGVIDIERNIPK